MKVYEAVFKEGETEGVYALSVVENPAMEDMWVALSEHPKEIELAAVDQDKRLLLGAALIPNKKIYRNVDGNEFFITFKEDTIEKLAHNFFKDQNNNNSSLEHNIKLEGMSVVEGWIVEDPKTDKSALYGKEYEKGTWVTMMKVDNEDIWQKAKNGEIKGFSIDALLGMQEVKLNTNIMNDELKKNIVDEVIDGVKALFSSKDEPKEVENIEVQPEVVEEVKEDFDKEAFMTEVIETVKTQFSEQSEKEIEAVKVELSSKIDELTKENEQLKTELNKQPEAEPIKSKAPKGEIKLNESKLQTTKSRVFEALHNNFWN